MIKLFVLNAILIAIISIILFFIKKYVKNEKTKKILLIVAPLLTILCHYSSIPYHYFLDNSAIDFLRSNPNLILPIYPCNVVMWCSLILGLTKKDTKVGKFLINYIFLFGVISALVGLFANVDFVRNPTLKDFDVTKGILAHGFMLFNVLLIPVLGYFKLDLNRNIPNIIISIIMMALIGIYCNMVCKIVGSDDFAYQVNSMFLIHSPFDGINFLTYPIIAVVALFMYFIIIFIIELFVHKKDHNYFYKRISEFKK